jgi:sugar lactone lactonase YvrE
MRTSSILPLAVLAVAACSSAEPVSAVVCPAPELETVWTLDGLSEPESVALSADGTFFYVSQVGGEGEAKDGDGRIARVSRDGRLIDGSWASGLNGPKGLALKDGRLYASDIDAIAVIDARSGAVQRRVPVTGAVFLNDAAVAPDGSVLFSDSGRARIYVLDGETVSTWLSDDLLSAVNGLLVEPDRLIVTTMQGRLLAIDWSTKAITVLAEGLADADGVVRLKDGTYLVSEWPGRLFHVRADGTNSVVKDTRGQDEYINDYILDGDVVVAAQWEPGRVSAWRVRRGSEKACAEVSASTP